MEKKLADELKKLEIEIAQKLFSIAKEKGIPAPPSPLQARILDFLFKNKDREVNQKDIEMNLGVSKATISGALNAMEKNNLIKRITSIKDSRSKQIIATEESQKTSKCLKVIFDDLNKELVKDISEEELNAFYSTMNKLSKNIRQQK